MPIPQTKIIIDQQLKKLYTVLGEVKVKETNLLNFFDLAKKYH